MIARPFRPGVLWLGLVLFLGSAHFGPSHTKQQVVPVLSVLAPWMPTDCLACAVLDEAHQARVPGRHGSVRDVAVDSLGALAALIVVRTRQRLTDDRVVSRTPLDVAQVDRSG